MLSENIGDKCLSFDLYGRNVQFTFHGHEKFRTKFGAFCTFLVGFTVITYALISLNGLLNPQPTMPVQSRIFYKSFHDMLEGTDGVMERNGSIGTIQGYNQAVRPMKFFAFALG